MAGKILSTVDSMLYVTKVENQFFSFPRKMDIIERRLGETVVFQRKPDGYINATQICKAAGKLWADYYRLKGTQEIIKALEV